jgi:hypothetical protein
MFVMCFGSVSPLSSSPLPPFIFSILIEAGLLPPQQVWQFSNVSRNPSRLILAEQLGRRSSPWRFLEIDIRELLAAVIAHDKAGLQFLD